MPNTEPIFDFYRLRKSDPIFDFYHLRKSEFDPFIKKYRKELEPILKKHIELYGPLLLGEKEGSWGKLSINLVIDITELSASESAMRGLHDDLRLKVKGFAMDFNQNEFVEGTHLSRFSEHWKNVGHYCFIIVYLHIINASKKGSN
ncbi:MAG: hypothetical protein QNJ58_14320 [Desulfobacterales bacterium]|nr:hypothetical protein [Desulfobacterales bacterium]